MPKLPAVTAKIMIRALKRAGFEEDRQKGSHLILRHPLTQARTVVPIHPGVNIKKTLFHAIIRDSKMTQEDFLKLL